MGQARQRGTFEQRRELALKRAEERRKNAPPPQPSRPRLSRDSWTYLRLAAIFGLQPPSPKGQE